MYKMYCITGVKEGDLVALTWLWLAGSDRCGLPYCLLFVLTMGVGSHSDDLFTADKVVL